MIQMGTHQRKGILYFNHEYIAFKVSQLALLSSDGGDGGGDPGGEGLAQALKLAHIRDLVRLISNRLFSLFESLHSLLFSFFFFD